MIEASGLSKRYGAVRAVDNLSFTVKPGSVTGFLGPNGSGKSTTMRMILGLDRPDRPGHDRRAGLRRSRLAAAGGGRATRSPRISSGPLGALASAGARGGGDIPDSRVDEVLGAVGLSDAAHRRAGKFSLGMSQRLGIASALLGDPRVLILDEPVNGLDPQGVRWIRTLLRSLAAEGRTVLVSSHLISEIALVADHLIVIGGGRMLADTTVADLSARSGSLEDAFLTLTSGGAA